MKKRRAFLAAMGGITTASVWHQPIVKSVVLPAHAQTTGAAAISLSCSMQLASSSEPLPEGASTTDNVTITFSTNPPAPAAPISWVGQCDGVNDFPIQNDVLDEFGEFEILAVSNALCDGGPPDPGTELTHVVTLDGDGASASCSYIFDGDD